MTLSELARTARAKLKVTNPKLLNMALNDDTLLLALESTKDDMNVFKEIVTLTLFDKWDILSYRSEFTYIGSITRVKVKMRSNSDGKNNFKIVYSIIVNGNYIADKLIAEQAIDKFVEYVVLQLQTEDM